MKASKILSVLLIIAMCFSMMAVTAFAAGPVVVIGNAPANGEGANVTADSQKGSESDGGDAAVVVVGENAPAQEPAAETSAPEEPGTGSADNSGAIVFYAANNTGAEENGEGEEKTDTLAADTVALVSKTEYTSLAKAIAEAKEKDTIKLVKNVTLTATLTVDGNITLDLGGKTLTFNPDKDQEAAISVSGKATIKNGSIVVNTFGKETKGGFANAILSSGTLTLSADVSYAAPTAGGSMLAVSGKSGSISVISGEYSADPSAFVGEGSKATETKNGWLVEEIKDEDEGKVDVTDTGKAAEPEKTYLAQIGENKYETLAEALEVAEDKATVTLLAATKENVPGTKNVTVDLGGFVLTGSVSVAEDKEVTVKNGSVTGDVSCSGKLTLEAVKLAGNIHLTDGSTLNVNGTAVEAKNIDAEGNVTVNIQGGTFGTLEAKNGSVVTGNVTGGTFAAIPEVFLAANYEAVQDGELYKVQEKQAPPATATVKNADGSVTYNADDDDDSDHVIYKKQDKNSDLVFTVDSELEGVSVNNSSIAGSYSYADGKVTIPANASFLANLPAGKNLLSFKFENGVNVNVLLYVIGHVEMKTDRYVLSSNTGLSATVSDTPDMITCGKTSDGTDHTALSSGDYTVSGSTVTLSSAYLDKLETGDWYIGYWNDEAVVMFPIVVAPAPSVTVTDDNKDAKWYYGDGVLKFDVSPDVKSVAVDNGGTIDAKNYSVNDDGILTLKAAFLKTLTYGEHTLIVTTSDGNASVKFTTAPSVVAKNGSNHTKGGSKDLVFISSDAVTEVYVGKNKLDSEKYSLSSDGKTITLKAAFLNTLKADTTYTLTVNGSAGAASTTFKILSPGSAASNPKTGDEGNVALWAAVLVLSGAAAAALMPRRKKQ